MKSSLHSIARLQLAYFENSLPDPISDDQLNTNYFLVE